MQNSRWQINESKGPKRQKATKNSKKVEWQKTCQRVLTEAERKRERERERETVCVRVRA